MAQIWVTDDQDKVPCPPELELLVQRVVEQVLEVVHRDFGKDAEVSVRFVDDLTIKDLNKDHRGLAKPTDVLSFGQLEGMDMPRIPGEPVLLGDVVISLERALDQAAEYGHSLQREVGFLTAHGALHLLGYDHGTPEEERVMMELTESILSSLGLHR